MSRSLRSFAVVLLSLLLLGMQSEGLRHALAHSGAALTSANEPSLHTSNDAPCVECRLLAGSANAIVGAAPLATIAFVAAIPLAWVLLSRPQAAPAFYQSRAPPSPL